MSRPRNGIREKAYAASDAVIRDPATLMVVTIRLFTAWRPIGIRSTTSPKFCRLNGTGTQVGGRLKASIGRSGWC